MSRFPDPNQGRLELFGSPFSKGLSSENRWVKLRSELPWGEMSQIYYKSFASQTGPPVKSAQIVIGAIIIKHKLKLSDRETVAQVQENPYMQYFLGFDEFSNRVVFDPSLLVHIRKRIGEEMFAEFEQLILEHSGLVKPAEDSEDDPSPPSEQVERYDSGSSRSSQTEADSPSVSCSEVEAPSTHKGKLVIDAVVTEQQIKYPTDLELLNDSRKQAERLFDLLYQPSKGKIKPRTYRQVARKAFLKVAKLRRKSKNTLRKAIRKQLNYVKRDLELIDKMFETAPELRYNWTYRDLQIYWVIQHIYEQQREMHQQKVHQCDHRIVNIYQPWVRPVVTGKAAKKTEFGAKVSVSLINGLTSIHAIRWNNFHEGNDLIGQVEAYKARFGFWPESLSADTKYGSRQNRKWLKEHGIRFSGKALGRPKKNPQPQDKALAKLKQQEQNLRSTIEGKFGQGKNGYGLAKIRARRNDTARSWIAAIFFVMNIKKITQADLILPFWNLFQAIYATYSDRMSQIQRIRTIAGIQQQHRPIAEVSVQKNYQNGFHFRQI
ncbi:MAG: IS5 family transposase [Candidatus Brocadiaceae bacterium]|nr:IS5 family transposase [Candidatus Brocadiaceae bacterium]